MKQDWEDYEEAADRGPLYFMLKLLGGLLVLAVLVGLAGWAMGWFSEAEQVARTEYGPRALLKKYEWFKNTSAELGSKRANIAVYEKRVRDLDQTYAGVPRRDWPREDREARNQWVSELDGLKANYNNLAAEYNAQMAKVNWRFANAGDLPAGETEPLPREFAPYRTE